MVMTALCVGASLFFLLLTKPKPVEVNVIVPSMELSLTTSPNVSESVE